MKNAYPVSPQLRSTLLILFANGHANHYLELDEYATRRITDKIDSRNPLSTSNAIVIQSLIHKINSRINMSNENKGGYEARLFERLDSEVGQWNLRDDG